MERCIDLTYAQVDDRQLKLDLYLPEDVEPPLPLIVWVHGGAWRAGTKSHPFALRLVPKGYAVASVEYRLSQEATFPAQIHDVKAAIRWLRVHAADYDLDPDRFGAWGDSAGGHLVALLGVLSDVAAAEAAGLEGDVGTVGVSSAVAAVCDWYGPSDFLHMNDEPGTMDHDAPDSPESQLIGAPIQQNRDLVARANPITYVTADAPPFLIMHGTADRTVLPSQSRLFHDALVEAGAQANLILVGGLGHVFRRDGEPAEPGRMTELYRYVEGFFNTYL